jgi:outer membrane protein OmpA-like peptidoglycan-associated protein
MKKYINTLASIALLLLLSAPTFAQRSGFGIHFGGYDFYGPQTGKYFRSEVYKRSYNTNKFGIENGGFDTVLTKNLKWNPLAKASMWWEVNDVVDLNMGLSVGSLEYPTDRPDNIYINKQLNNISGTKKEKILLEYDAHINFNLVPKNQFVFAPYLFTGITASYHDVFFGANLPVGIGANIRLGKSNDVYLNIESAYKIAATDNDQNHLQHTIGFVYFYKKGYKEPVKEVVPTLPVVIAPAVVEQPKILDADKDGVNDDVDQCPTIAGLAKYNGCPDTDNDGIADNKDTCPLVAGLAAFNGCPDTDGDGISDNTDACPYVAGVAQRNGCPIPDTDGDGFNDDQDKCPTVFSKVNNGCPEIKKEIIERVNKAAKSIYFETGKSVLKPISYKDLDALVAILNSDVTLRVDIGGHTDNAGSEEINVKLSHDRAKAVNDYLISKGIAHERLTYQGYGSSKPVNKNETAAEKAQNRRTELNLRNY